MKMKKMLSSSLIWRALTAVSDWLDRQWEKSFLKRLCVGAGGQWYGGLTGRICGSLHRALRAVFRALRLDRLLEGSVFRRTYFWMALTVLAAPLLPTMVVLVLALISIVSLVFNYGCDGERHMTRSPLTKWVAGFAAVYFVSTLLSVDLRGSLRGGMVIAVFTLFTLVVMDSCRDRAAVETLARCIVVSGTLVSLYGIAQAALGLESTNAWVDLGNFDTLSLRVYSTLENPNVLSEYLMLTTPLAVACAVNAKTLNGRLTGAFAAVSMAVCLAMTYSRGGFLGLAFGMMVFLVLLDRRYLALGIVALAALLAVMPGSLAARIASIGTLSDSSTSYRVYIWMATVNLLRDYWLGGIGTGVAAFQKVYPRYSFNAVSAPHAHNLFLQIFCECGILGIVTLLGTIISYVRETARTFRKADKSGRILSAAMLASMAGFVVQSLTDHSFYNYRVTLMFWVFVGLAAAMGACLNGEKEAER